MGDKLVLKLKDGGKIRIVPRASNGVDKTTGGVTGEGVLPRGFILTQEHAVQIFTGERTRPAVTREPGATQRMIGFGPNLRYSSLRIDGNLKGMYIAVDLADEKHPERGTKFVCRTEGSASEGTKKIAEMLDQALWAMNEFGSQKGDPASEELGRIFERMKSRVTEEGNHLSVEAAFNLEANSAFCGSVVVFNHFFLDHLYQGWVINRTDPNEQHMSELASSLVLLSERLFHEIAHESDEVQQILADRLFYICMVKDREAIRKCIREYTSLDLPEEQEAGALSATFQEFFGTKAYYKMIHRIAAMDDIRAIRREAETYLEAANREYSQPKALSLSPGQLDKARAMLSEHGINDDLFAETISGVGFSDFFRRHALFSDVPPFDSPEIERERQLYASYLYRMRSVNEVKKHIMMAAAKVNKVDETVRALSSKKTNKDLNPLIQWAARVKHPQNYERSSGRLFNSVHYKGLNLLTMPIFPVDEKNEIRWDLLGWAHAGEHEKLGRRAPTKQYYNDVDKISLYEYLRLHEASEGQHGDTYCAIPSATGPEQLELFGDGEMPGVGRQKLPGKDHAREFEDMISNIHALIPLIDTANVAGERTYIIIDNSIPGSSQQEIMTLFNKHSRERLVAEKILFMDRGEISDFVKDGGNACTKGNTVVLVGDPQDVDKFGNNVRSLVVTKDGMPDLVNIEGLVGLARSMLAGDWGSFIAIYKMMTGSECPEIKAGWMNDPAEFARNIVVLLPKVDIIDVGQQGLLNELAKRTWFAA